MKTLHSLEELKEEYKEVLEKEKTLKEHGINVCDSELEDIKIISMDDRNLTVKNAKTGEIITSNIYPYFNNRVLDLLECHVLIKSIKDGVVKEQYHYFNNTYPRGHKYIKKLCANNKINNDSLFLERVSTDVETKYGNFCLCFENNLKYTFYDPSVSMGLYHGNIEGIEYGGFIEPTYFGLLKNTKYCSDINTFYNMILGFKEGDCKQHRWMRTIPESNSFVYASDKQVNSVIMEDANVDVKKYRDLYNEIPIDRAIRYSKHYLSNEELVSKAYFTAYTGDFFAIEKTVDVITLVHTNKERFSNKDTELLAKVSFSNMSDGKISLDEIDSIIEWLKVYKNTQSENTKFLDSVLQELKVYKNLKDNCNKKFNFTNPYTLNVGGFDELTEELRKKDIKELVENIIELNSDEFNISVEELKGDVCNAEKNMTFIKERKKNKSN